MRRDEPPVEQCRDAAAQAPLAKLREHQRHIIVVTRHAAADAEGLVERLADEPRHFRVSARSKPGSTSASSGNSRSSERQKASIVENRDVAEPFLHLAPPRRVELREAARLLQPVDDALPHLGRRLAREGGWRGCDPVRRRRASRLTYRSTSTRVLPVPAEASRMTSARDRRRDAARRRRGGPEPPPHRRTATSLRHRRRNPSGTPTRNCTSHSATHRRASAGIRRA